MMKITYILILFPLLLQGQEYPRIDTLDFGAKAWLVKHFFKPVNGNEEIFRKYYFNKSGKHISTYSGYNSERQTKTKHEYNKHGQLIAIERYEYMSPKNDSLKQAFEHELNQELRKYDNIDQEFDWAKLHEKYEPLYEKVLPETVNWKNDARAKSKIIIKRDLLDRDSIMEIYSDIFNNKLTLNERIEFYYNHENKLELKRFIDIPQANTYSFQAFKSNSTEFTDSIKNLDGIKKEIKYTYGKNYTKLDFFVNGIHTGYKEETWNRNKTKKTEIVFNMNNDTLSHYLIRFNKFGKIKKWKRLKQVGITGFGYSMDYIVVNKKTYQYDDNDRLQQIFEFENDDHLYIERFEIINQ